MKLKDKIVDINEMLSISRAIYGKISFKNEKTKSTEDLISLYSHPFLKPYIKKFEKKREVYLYIIRINHSDYLFFNSNKERFEIYDIEHNYRIISMTITEGYYFTKRLIKIITPNEVASNFLDRLEGKRDIKRKYLKMLKKEQLISLVNQEREKGFIHIKIPRLPSKSELATLLVSTPRIKKSHLDDLFDIIPPKEEKRRGTREKGRPSEEYFTPISIASIPIEEFKYLTEDLPFVKLENLLFLEPEFKNYNGIKRLTKTYFKYLGSTLSYDDMLKVKNANKKYYYIRIRKWRNKNPKKYKSDRYLYQIYLRKKENA